MIQIFERRLYRVSSKMFKVTVKERKERELAARKASAPTLPNLNDPRAIHRFFLEQVHLGESLLNAGHIEDAVQHFAYAVVVCGQPTQLLQVLQQSLSPSVFSMLVAALPDVRKIIINASNLTGKRQVEEELE